MPPRLLVSRSGSRSYNRLLPRRSSLTISSEVDSQVLTATCSRTSNSSSTKLKRTEHLGSNISWLAGSKRVKKKLYRKNQNQKHLISSAETFFLFLFSSVLFLQNSLFSKPISQSLLHMPLERILRGKQGIN